jgi:hypothetical protein
LSITTVFDSAQTDSHPESPPKKYWAQCVNDREQI